MSVYSGVLYILLMRARAEALTNPLVLLPIGNLSQGKYVAKAHIDSFILSFDSTGKPVFTPIKL